MNTFRLVAGALSVAMIIAISACSSNSSSPSTTSQSPPDLTGTYFGSGYDGQLTTPVASIKFEINGIQVVSGAWDGQARDVSATIAYGDIKGVTYIATQADGTEIGFAVSSNGKYIGYVIPDSNGSFQTGILEKDATAHANYTQNTFTGTWTGLQYELNSNLDIVGYGAGSTSTAADGSFIGTGVKQTFTSTTNVSLDASYGSLGYAVASALQGATNKDVKILLSPDGNAAAAWMCDSGSESLATCGFSLIERDNSIFTVELAKTSAELNDVMSRHLQFSIGALASSGISCAVVKPVSGVSCSLASYDSVSHLLTIPVSGIGDATIMSLDLSSTAQDLPVSNDGSVNNSGNAIYSHARLRVRTQHHPGNYDYTVVVLQNPDPSYRTAVLYGASSGPITLWDNNFASVVDSYFMDDLNDGVPNKTGSYVSINSSASKNPYLSGAYRVVLGNHVSGDAKKTQTYTYLYNYVPSDSDLLALSGITPTRANIDVGALTGMANYAGIDTPYTLAANLSHTLTWSMPGNEPAGTYWQVRFRIVSDTNNNHLKNREYRSDRMLNTTLANDGQSYFWTIPPEFSSQLNTGEFIKLQIQASNADNTISDQSAGVFMLPTLIAQ